MIRAAQIPKQILHVDAEDTAQALAFGDLISFLMRWS